jgi:hypothetical protein
VQPCQKSLGSLISASMSGLGEAQNMESAMQQAQGAPRGRTSGPSGERRLLSSLSPFLFVFSFPITGIRLSRMFLVTIL